MYVYIYIDWWSVLTALSVFTVCTCVCKRESLLFVSVCVRCAVVRV